MDPRLRDILVCPSCKGQLSFQQETQELLCPACRLAFPVRDGIPIMLQDEARKTDAPPATGELVAS